MCRWMSMRLVLDGERAGLVFEACHLVPGNGKCSRLHPHFHRVSVAVEGSLSPRRRVLHIYRLKYLVMRMCSELDGKVLLARYPEGVMRVEHLEGAVRVVVNRKEYILPEEDVAVLPIPSLNTEDLCLYFSERIVEAMRREFDLSNVEWVEVSFDEGGGQMASHRVEVACRGAKKAPVARALPTRQIHE